MNAPMMPAMTAAGLRRLQRSRRVTRQFGAQPIAQTFLELIVHAGRSASSGGNNRIHRFLVLRDRELIRLVRAMSPGMLGYPTALVVVCTDLHAAALRQINADVYRTRWIDVGTAMANMMLMVEALGLGSCPLTSFSQGGVSVVLDLPKHAVPEVILQVGRRPGRRAVDEPSPEHARTVDPYIYWDRYSSQR